MRISTTQLILLICSVLFFSASYEALAQAPDFVIDSRQHACGGTANGSFNVHVTAATGTVNILILGPAGFTRSSPPITGYSLPFDFAFNSLPGTNSGANYIVVVSDANDNTVKNTSIFNFTVTLGTVNQNTNPGCATPNGSISVNLAGSSPNGPIQFTWTGPGGPYNTQNLTGLAGGTYNLSYTDGSGTTCTLGPVTITDPAPAPFTISTPSSTICAGNAFDVNVSATTNGYTYDVLEGATVLASAAGTGSAVTINVAALPAGPHTLRVRATQGSCPSRFNDPSDISITISPAPDYNNLSAGTTSVCSGTGLGVNLNTLKKATSVTATSFNVISINSTGLTGSNPTGTITATDLADDVWKNTTNGNLDVTYTIATFAGSCPGNTITVTVTIQPQPDYNNYNNDLFPGGICSKQSIGVTLDALKKATSVLADSYNVTNIVSTNLTATGGSPATGVATNTSLSDDQWQNTTNSPQNVVYTVVPNKGTCAGDPFTVTVTINPQPDYNSYVNNNTPGGICSNDPIAVNVTTLKKPTSVTATSFLVSVNSAGLPQVAGAGTPNDISDDQWRNVTSGQVNVLYTIIPVIGTCQGNPFTVGVTIKPQPDYNNYNNNSAPSICSEDVIGIDLLSLRKGTSVAATSYNIGTIVSTGLTATAGSPTPNVTNRTASEIADDKWENITSGPLDVVYTITPVTGVCLGDPFTVRVTIAPEPDYKNYADDNAPGGICSNDVLGVDLSTLKQATSVAATAYRINSIVSTGLTIGGGSPAANPSLDVTATEIGDDQWVNTTNAAIQVTYTVVPKTGTCLGDPFTVVVTINPRPSYKNYNNDNIPGGICADPLGIDVTTLKNTTSIAATSFTVNSITSAGLTQAAGTATPDDISDDVWSNVTNTSHDVIYTITPLTGTCAGTPFTVTVTIKPQPDYTSTPVTVCSGIAVGLDLNAVKAPASGTASSFDITVNAAPGLIALGGSPANATNVASNVIADDIWQNFTNGSLDVIYTLTPRIGSCAGTPFMITVTINPEPSYSSTGLADICSGDAIGIDFSTLKVASSISATSFDFTTNLPAGLTAVGTTTATGTGPSSIIADDQWKNVTNAPITLIYTITPKSAFSCVGAPFTVTVRINPQPDYNNYNNDLAPGGICSTPLGIDLNTLKKSTSVAATSFNISITQSTGLTQVGGAATTADLSDDVWSNVTNVNHDVIYTVVPVIGTCDGDPFTVTVTILPTPEYTNGTGTICSNVATGIDLNALKKATSAAATAFTVSSINQNGLTGTTGNPAIISDDVWKNVSNAPVDVTYTIIPKAGACDGAPFTVIVTVNPEPVGAADAATVCSNNSVAYDLQNNVNTLGNGITPATYSWIAADNTNVSGESTSAQTGSVINNVLVNNTSADQVVVYDVVPASSSGCIGSVFKISITVAPRPVLVAGQTKEICAGTAVGYEIQLNPANTPAGTMFTWPDPDGAGDAQASPPGGVAAGPAGTLHINDVLNTAGTVTYVVTPMNGSCAGTPQNVVITVDPAAIVEAGPNQAICVDNGPYTLVGSSVTGASSKGRWRVISTPAVHDEILSDTTLQTNPAVVTFTATNPGDYVLRLESDKPSNVCGKAADFVTITVTPKPVIAPNQNPLVCANDPSGYSIQMSPANFPAGTMFSWPDPDGSGPATASPPGGVAMGAPGTAHLNDILRNNGTTNIDVIYVVTPFVGLCVGDPVSITVTVKPGPVVAFGQTKTICSGERVDYEILLSPANSPAGTVFSWPDPDGAGSATSRNNIPADPLGKLHITDTLYNGTNAPINVVYQVISRGTNGCTGVTRDVTIVVNPGALADAGLPKSVCSGGTVVMTGASIAGTANATWSIIGGPTGGVISPSTPTSTPASATFTAITPGVYTLQLTTDPPTSGSCGAVVDVVTVTVKDPSDPSCTGGPTGCPTDIIPVVTNSTCNNSDGAVRFDIIPGLPLTGDVRVTIDGPTPKVQFASVQGLTFTTLASGSYTYEVEYGTSCVRTGVFSIDRSGTVGTPVATVVTNPNCFSDTGTATIDAPNQTGINLEWSANGTTWTPFIGGAPVSGLPSGSNLIFVRRPGDPCAGGVVITFNTPADFPLVLTPVNATCSGNDGSIEVTNNTGGPYAFQVNGTPTILPADNVFHGLAPNTYKVVVSDAKGCSKTYSSLIVGQVVGPATLDTLYVKKAISAPDLPSGSMLVGVKPSGLEPYETRLELTTPLFASQQYVSDWSEVSLNPQNLKFEKSYTNIYSGVYQLGLRDAGGCTKLYVINIGVDTNLLIPNVFTPNDDGHNDVFFIRNLPNDSKLLITNRWGKEVYKTSSYQNDWNGGDTVDGIYFYNLTVAGQKYTGWVEILRAR